MYHLHVRYISKSSLRSVLDAYDYIARIGRYARRGDAVREVISVGMPQWIQQGDREFWETAQSTSSRVNARLCYLIECALPRQLTVCEQRDVVMHFIKMLTELSVDIPITHALLPASIAIHEGHGVNPHLHAMLSTSLNDGIDRDQSGWFKRAHPTQPSQGGARRSRVMGKKPWLYKVRETWALVANDILSAAGHDIRLDHRSHRARAISHPPGMHLGPAIQHLMRIGPTFPTWSTKAMTVIATQKQSEAARTAETASKKMRLLEAQAAVDNAIQERWHDNERRLWKNLLAHHPMTSQAETMRTHATLILYESDPHVGPTTHQSTSDQALQQQWLARINRDFLPIHLPPFTFLVRSGSNDVVVLGETRVATDSSDVEALTAVIHAAHFPWRSPRFYVADRVRHTVVEILKTLVDPPPTSLPKIILLKR